MAYETSSSHQPWILRGFFTLGAIVIGIGLISLVAANWKEIPDSWKLFADFTLLITLSVGAYWKRNQPAFFEILLVIFLILCLASIGLISQIYHTGGETYEALLLWSAITSGATATAKRSFVPFFWTTGLFLGIIWMIADRFSYLTLSFVPLLSASLALISAHIGGGKNQIRPFIFWMITSGILTLITVEMASAAGRLKYNVEPAIITYTLAIFLICGIWKGTNIQKRLLWLALIFYLIPLHFPLFTTKPPSWAFATTSIALLVTITLFVASFKQRLLFHFFLVFLGFRFLILYFQALGGLATTGLSLIISGLIIILTTVAWNKYRHQIVTWAEGITE